MNKIIIAMMLFVSNISMAQYRQMNTVIIVSQGAVTQIDEVKITNTYCSHCYVIDTVFLTLATNSILLWHFASGPDTAYFKVTNGANTQHFLIPPVATYLGEAQLKFRFEDQTTANTYEVLSDTIGIGLSNYQFAETIWNCGYDFVYFDQSSVLIDTILALGVSSINYQIQNNANGSQIINLSFGGENPDNIIILWLDGSIDNITFYNEPQITMSASQSFYVTGGWNIDTVIIKKGCWNEFGYQFLEDQCGHRFTLAGGGGGPNTDSYEFGWIGWWRFGQQFVNGSDTITVYSNSINFLPNQGQHNVSGWYDIYRDPLCIGDSLTSLLCVLNHNCVGDPYTMTDIFTANLFLPENVANDGTVWWDTSTVAKTYTYEVENSNEFYTISFDLGNCVGLSTQQLEDNKDNLLVYPNPTTGLITISGLASNNSSLTVHDALGQTVWQGTGTEVYLTDYPTGFYFLTVSSPERIEIFKIIKE